MSGIRLVRFGPEHDAAFLEAIRDPEIRRFTPAPDIAPEGYAETWRGRFADGRRAAFAVLDAEDRFVGYAVTPELDRVRRTAELGYAVAAAHRGRGVATEVLRLLTDWAVGEGIADLRLLIDRGNLASQRVAERCGYRLGSEDADGLQTWSRSAD